MGQALQRLMSTSSDNEMVINDIKNETDDHRQSDVLKETNTSISNSKLCLENENNHNIQKANIQNKSMKHDDKKELDLETSTSMPGKHLIPL